MEWFLRTIYSSVVATALLWRTTAIFSQPLDNLQFLSSLTDSLVYTVVQEYLAPAGHARIKPLENENPNNWFVEDRLTHVLGANRYSIYLEHEDDPLDLETANEDQTLQIQFRILNIGITYQNAAPGPEAKVRRSGRVRLFLRLVNEFSGKVLWSGMSEKTGSEWIQEDDVPNVENHNIPFTRGKYESRSKSIGLFQPLLVSTAAGVIVYLFYALRSR